MIPPITTVNVELTSRCQKNCWCCGRRKTERDNPDIIKTYGDMPMDMVTEIAEQLPHGIFVHLHNNGEPLLYPQFGVAVDKFNNQFTHITTNGKLLIEKFDELQRLNTIAISVIEDDPEADEQYEIMEEYFAKPIRPTTTIRLNGLIFEKRYRKFGVPLVKRILHNPMGSYDYTHDTTIPETGVCCDMLYHPAINKDGDISICVRYDPDKLGVIGNVKEGVIEVLNGNKRYDYICKHMEGNRDEVPLCSKCEYWGVPKGV